MSNRESQGDNLLSVKQIKEDVPAYLNRIGEVFRVFDKQDSGCISYGVVVEGVKWFVKTSTNAAAAGYLRDAMHVYSSIKHQYLPKLVHSFNTEAGLALVYEWVEGEVLSSPDYPGADGKKNPLSPFYRFRHLPIEKILTALGKVYDLHVYMERQGYVAVDFYAGSMIYDFARDDLHFCDLDHYVQGAFILEQDRLPGSRSLMAPEEFVRGRRIDHQTNVYTMGAVAFLFLGGSERSIESWRSSEPIYRVAVKAVSPNREDRYGSIQDFYKEWLTALAG
jgi:serine/threonine protein kinase, bacterial